MLQEKTKNRFLRLFLLHLSNFLLHLVSFAAIPSYFMVIDLLFQHGKNVITAISLFVNIPYTILVFPVLFSLLRRKKLIYLGG